VRNCHSFVTNCTDVAGYSRHFSIFSENDRLAPKDSGGVVAPQFEEIGGIGVVGDAKFVIRKQPESCSYYAAFEP